MNVGSPQRLSILGAALLILPAQHYRVDRVLCPDWPDLGHSLCWSGVYLLAVALLSVGWLGMVRGSGGASQRGIRQVLWQGLPVHLMALLCPPFLSQDPVFYAALGKALAVQGTWSDHGMRLCDVLPVTDPFLLPLPEAWRCGTSAYGPGFDALAALIYRAAPSAAMIGRLWGALPGSPVAWALRLHQGAAAAALFLGAALTGQAAGARAAALVLFCPLAIIEATVNAHNDVYLLLGSAAFACLLRSGRHRAALAALVAGLLCKGSAALLVALYCAQRVMGLPWTRRLLLALGATAAAAAAGLWLLLRHRAVLPPVLLQQLGQTLPYEYCTRSIECLPRVLLREVLHAPRWAQATNLLFRLAGAALILALAARYRGRNQLFGRAAAALLFFYYLYLHGWAQSWYWLPLLPLLPFADQRYRPAMVTLCVSAVVYYALVIPWNCVQTPLQIAVTDLCEGLIVVVPPTLCLALHRPRRLRRFSTKRPHASSCHPPSHDHDQAPAPAP